MLLIWMNCFHDLECAQIPLQTHRPCPAEGAAHRAADLGREACGHPSLSVGKDHRFDNQRVMQFYSKFDGIRSVFLNFGDLRRERGSHSISSAFHVMISADCSFSFE